MTVGKRVQFDEETWAVVNFLRQERRRSFQQLADEAFTDLLAKHGHPVDLKNQLRASLGEDPVKRQRRARKASTAQPAPIAMCASLAFTPSLRLSGTKVECAGYRLAGHR